MSKEHGFSINICNDTKYFEFAVNMPRKKYGLRLN